MFLGFEDFGDVDWLPAAKTAIVTALAHPEGDPRLDWYLLSGTKFTDSMGNRRLIRTNRRLASWLQATEGVKAHPLPYLLEKGGIYLKDAAVLAGLGCIGRNNLLVTPEFGPRIRLRAMLLETQLEATGLTDFDPCEECPEHCRTACPQEAFSSPVCFPRGTDVSSPPARDSFFRRARCRIRTHIEQEPAFLALRDTMDGLDMDVIEEAPNKEDLPIKTCRLCEFACPVGSGGSG
jgi:epoxyqueuosine reductase